MQIRKSLYSEPDMLLFQISFSSKTNHWLQDSHGDNFEHKVGGENIF